MPKGTPTALHRPEMTAMENMEINAEATTAKDGAKTENMAINAEATTAKGGAKTEANRKKKERQKAKARAEKDAAAAGMAIAGVLPSAEAVAAAAATAPQMLSERRHAGEDRGLGMFAKEAIQCGRCIASATPARHVAASFANCEDFSSLYSARASYLVGYARATGSYGFVGQLAFMCPVSPHP